MGQFLPATIAFIIRVFGIFIYTKSYELSQPQQSVYIFLFGVYLLLWNLELYPKSLKKLKGCLSLILEFFIDEFIMEIIVADFWLAVCMGTTWLVNVLGTAIDGYLIQNSIVDLLKDETVGTILCISLAIFFLFAVLHAIQAIDLGDLECGIVYFFKESIYRTKKNFRRKIRLLGFGRRRVQIRSRSRRKLFGGRSSNPCCLGTDHYSGYDYGNEPMDKERNHDDLRSSFSDFEMSLDD